MFLEDEQIVKLTGYRQKAKQVARLRKLGILFFVNASGHPVVPDSSVNGSKQPKPEKTWTPSWAAHQA